MKAKRNTADHCLEIIREDLSLLGASQMKHIDGCTKCRAEYEIYQRLERAIATLPEMSMPETLRQQILAELLRPAYSLQQLLAVLAIACLSPILLSVSHLKAFFAPGLVAGIYGGSGFLILLLLIPLVHYLMLRHRIDVDSLKTRIDDLLERRAN